MFSNIALEYSASDETSETENYQKRETTESNKLKQSKEHAANLIHFIPTIEENEDTCSAVTFNILLTMKQRRESGFASHHWRNLDRCSKRAVGVYISGGQFKIAACVMFERLHNPTARQNVQVFFKRVAKLTQFCSDHDVTMNLVHMALSSIKMHAHAHLKDIDKAAEYLQQIYLRADGLQGGYEKNLLFDQLGCLYFGILKTFSYTEWKELLYIVRALGHKVDSEQTSSKHIFHACVRIIRNAAFDAFRRGREALLGACAVDESGVGSNKHLLISYYYVGSLEANNLLLKMAKVLLDLPEWPSGQSRFLVTKDDLDRARQCIDAIKLDKATSRNTRFLGRYHITWAGYHYRECQMKQRNLQQLWEREKNFSANEIETEIREINNSLEQSIFCINNAASVVEFSEFEEAKIAKHFSNFLTKVFSVQIRRIADSYDAQWKRNFTKRSVHNSLCFEDCENGFTSVSDTVDIV